MLKRRCAEMNGRMEPPYAWCRNWRDDSSTGKRRIDPYAAEIPPPGCSIFNNGGGSGSFQHLILFPGVKMAFCGIPKGAW